MGKKIRSVGLILALCLALSPASVLAAQAGGVSYIDTDGVERTAADVTAVEAGVTTWDQAWYVVNDTVEVSERIQVSGQVNLILADGASLNAEQGINVPNESALTIWGQSRQTGALTATGSGYQAGIGGDGATCGDVTIHGGVLYAVGGVGHASGTAAIGGSNDSAGAITITGGTIIAIGSADESGVNGASAIDGGSITITGGTVTAKAGDSTVPAMGATPEFDGYAHVTYGNTDSNTATDTVVEQTGEEKDDWSAWHWVRIRPLNSPDGPADEAEQSPVPTAPKTGDETGLWLWMLLLAASLGGLGMVAGSMRKG